MKLIVEKQQTAGNVIQIVKVDGYLDAHTFPELERTLQSLMEAGSSRILLDFETLDYISSAGLGLLLGMHRMALQNQGGLKIMRMPESISRIFGVLGFTKVIEVYPDRQAALAAFGASGSGQT